LELVVGAGYSWFDFRRVRRGPPDGGGALFSGGAEYLLGDAIRIGASAMLVRIPSGGALDRPKRSAWAPAAALGVSLTVDVFQAFDPKH